MPIGGRNLGAKSSAVECLSVMVTQEYVTRFVIQAAEAPNTQIQKMRGQWDRAASCNAMNTERRLRRRIGVPSGCGVDERISTKVGANDNSSVSTLLVKDCNPKRTS